MTYLKNKEVQDARASGIFNSMKDTLTEKRITMHKVCGLRTDRASVMTGHLRGVTTLMHYENSYCISLH